ncbi:protein phosphatase 1L-like [Homalodisca vitripennis]|uniref:protein phosphatase 1L-like n=1 Tax=Homalodisca vitripennis TaxID=197043 RepID=UPI001EEBEE6A|nr:protein phosphatase 1L-like [Homalodisca vitripennis]
MEDELEDRIFYQTYLSHMKLVSKFAVGLPLNSNQFVYIWRILRVYVLKPEVIIFSAFLLAILVYLQAVDVWSRSLLGRLHFSLGRSASSKVQKLQFFVNTSGGDVDKLSWELKEKTVAAYAVQGRRPRMEDRFVVNENINNTGVSLFAIFDGHGGEFAANYARDNLINNLNNKVIELKKLIADGKSERSVIGKPPPSPKLDQRKGSGTEGGESVSRKSSFRKTTSQADECVKKSAGGGGVITDPVLLEKLEALNRPITREVRPTRPSLSAAIPPPKVESYLDAGCAINYGRLLTDEVLAADRLLVEAAKKTMDVAGTTALIALLEGSRLIVANVGDSRGVMCDSKGNAIPLSFDHKPQQMRERKRIKEAGGFITFNGVWRVAGILATSRALGDYPLKDKRLVIADPDILTFNLADHKPQFLVLASDGLWDTFTNEEAVSFIKERLGEPHFGAKSITLQSYYRGSLDNITVIVINLSDHVWSNTTASKKYN